MAIHYGRRSTRTATTTGTGATTTVAWISRAAIGVVIANHVPVEGVAVLLGVSEEAEEAEEVKLVMSEEDGKEVTLEVSVVPNGLEGGVNGPPVGAVVQFQSRQGYGAVSTHGVGCVLLGHNSDVGTPVGMGMGMGIPPGIPLAGDGVVVLLAAVDVEVESSGVALVLSAVASSVNNDEVASEGDGGVDSLVDEVVDDTKESDVVGLVAGGAELSVGIAFVTAETREELNQTVDDAEVSPGEKTLVVLLSTTMVIVSDPGCNEVGPVAPPVLFEGAVLVLDPPENVWFLLSGTVAITVNSSGAGVTAFPDSGEVSVSEGEVYPGAGEDVFVHNGPSVDLPVPQGGFVPLEVKFEPGMDQIVVVDLIVMTVIGKTLGASDAVVPSDEAVFEAADQVLSAEAMVALLRDEVDGDAAVLLSFEVVLANGGEVIRGFGLRLVP
ncbi:hypothetical protein G647_03283 [Cladophialophora carrionii CBS 160.54]|uniref:Uncharacterized protein n=1 Tax=Cladophialophora carrionii CBS 160.54 TaxID=1279043 RepID=V9DIL8_9EURO|nr:uncharacterized protein G647_03283 [Cladophialophora carrionii CBS 160.54]ETI26506.1 hypothetical protein G647_03283 [Cladophialophora carrionii CBS 160.54]